GEGARVDVSARVDGTTPVLEVADDGPGIPEAERADVWERFYRGEGAQAATSSGSGLGLSIVKAVAEMHGGGVFVACSGGVNTFGFSVSTQPCSGGPLRPADVVGAVDSAD
ncbi:sensor histidine kinase, partial [Enterobacter sp. DRP3]|nr:sensor histidine kinase [Enterobacter sp. DRP3]